MFYTYTFLGNMEESGGFDIKTFSEKFKDSHMQNKKTDEFWKNLQFVDVIIKAKDGTEFKVHKIVLASGCPYFKALFHSGMKESDQEIIELDRDLTGEDLETLLAYIYTGEIELNVEKAKIFCEYALYFGLNKLKDFCAHTLHKSLNLENCLELCEHGVKYLNNTLSRLCLKFILEKYADVVQINFFNLKNELYDEIIVNNELTDVEKLFSFLHAWIKVSFEERKIFLYELMKYFNFASLSNKFIIKNILQDESFQKEKDFFKQICDVFESNLSDKPSSREKYHYFVSMNKIYKIKNVGKCEEFDKQIKESSFEAHIYDYNHLFLCGGYNSVKCFCFCPYTNKLENLPAMGSTHYKHSIIEFNKRMYVMGGYLNHSVEIFDFISGKWYNGPLLKGKTESIGLTTWKNSIYLFGSFVDDKWSSIVERYDPNENNYSFVCEAPPIGSTKAVRIGDTVYCFNCDGGYKFNIRTNKWFEKIPKAPVQWTSIYSATLFGNYIGVLGYASGYFLYFLDPIKNIWSNDVLKLESNDIRQFV